MGLLSGGDGQAATGGQGSPKRLNSYFPLDFSPKGDPGQVGQDRATGHLEQQTTLSPKMVKRTPSQPK